MLGDVEDDLQDRAAQADRACAADDEPGPAALEHERGRHHAREAAPDRSAPTAPDGIEVVLAEHVVEMDARARNDHAGTGAAGSRQ